MTAIDALRADRGQGGAKLLAHSTRCQARPHRCDWHRHDALVAPTKIFTSAYLMICAYVVLNVFTDDQASERSATRLPFLGCALDLDMRALRAPPIGRHSVIVVFDACQRFHSPQLTNGTRAVAYGPGIAIRHYG